MAKTQCTIGDRIEEGMQSRGLTRQQLCKDAGITSSYLTKLLSGDRGDRIEYMTAWRIANAIGYSAHYLVTGTGNRDAERVVNDASLNRAHAAEIAAELGISERAIDAIRAELYDVKSEPSSLTWLLLMYARDLFLAGSAKR